MSVRSASLNGWSLMLRVINGLGTSGATAYCNPVPWKISSIAERRGISRTLIVTFFSPWSPAGCPPGCPPGGCPPACAIAGAPAKANPNHAAAVHTATRAPPELMFILPSLKGTPKPPKILSVPLDFPSIGKVARPRCRLFRHSLAAARSAGDDGPAARQSARTPTARHPAAAGESCTRRRHRPGTGHRSFRAHFYSLAPRIVRHLARDDHVIAFHAVHAELQAAGIDLTAGPHHLVGAVYVHHRGDHAAV